MGEYNKTSRNQQNHGDLSSLTNGSGMAYLVSIRGVLGDVLYRARVHLEIIRNAANVQKATR